MNYSNRIGQQLRIAVGGEAYKCYIPKPLPPQPEIQMSRFYSLLEKANTALGRLDGMRLNLPDASLFLYLYVRKEAVLSSQIEGTQSSLSDLLIFENENVPGVPIDDVTEVSNYVAAMKYGLDRLKEFPLSLRLIKEIHSKLMSSGRGSVKQPGEFRTSQNWIGGTRPGNALFVPPPPDKIMECLDSFEKFFHDESVKLPVLVKAALMHVQFETIHPFLDGNGRLGRLLITFMLCHEGLLEEPLLYLSLYLKTHRQKYYDLLQEVRLKGAWEEWIEFFLMGVIEVSDQATKTAQRCIELFESDRKKVEKSGLATVSILKVLAHLKEHPVTNTNKLTESCEISLPTALRAMMSLQKLGMIVEHTGKERHKIFIYKNYLSILDQGIDSQAPKPPRHQPND